MLALILDTETTGLLSNHVLPIDKQPEVIELFAVLHDLKADKVKAEYHSLFKPKKAITDEITKITGLTNEDLKDAPAFAAKAAEIKKLIEGAPTIIAHNASYDTEMLGIEFERLGQQLKWPRVICSVEQTVHVKGFRLNLQSLHELLLGQKFLEAHRAKTDTQALARCCVKMFEKGWL